MVDSLLWQPLLEASAQTIVGVLGAYGAKAGIDRMMEKRRFEGAMDFWKRGVEGRLVSPGDTIVFDGLISPYTQLFPGDAMQNATRWNSLYGFEGKISNREYQAMEFFAGSDAALRMSSLNGETLVGLYSRYGFIGDGLLGIAPTSYVRKRLPDFFHPDFYGQRARVVGRLQRCPAQHGFVAQGIAAKAGIAIDVSGYKDLFYLQISRIYLPASEEARVTSLLGSVWAVTDHEHDQYLVQYGYISKQPELAACRDAIVTSHSWAQSRVFFDDLTSPSEQLSFRRQYIY